MKLLIAFGAGLSVLALSTAASSHHAVNAQFDVNKEGIFTGALAKLDNVQPHSYWYFNVVKPDGVVEKWALEGPSPGNLRRSGLNVKQNIKVGTTYKVYYNVSRDGSATGYIKGVDLDGKRVNLAGE